jgi:hypothetical protein
MQDGLYMLPGEFVAFVAFLFAPPLILSLVVQTVVFAVRGVFARGLFGRAVVGYVATLVGSLGVGFAIHELAPRAVVPALRVREVIVGTQAWPVMPLAFLAVAVAASIATWWVLRSAHAPRPHHSLQR